MAFLAPLWLGLAALAGVPVLLHLWRRRVGVRLDFPALRYLLGAEAEANRDRRTRNLLLLILRVVAIAAAAIAAARPTWRSGGAPDAVAVVLDNSLSTGIREGQAPLSVALRSAAAELLSATDRTSRRWVVTADGSTRTVGGDAARAVEAIPQLAGRGQLASALQTAAQLVRGASSTGAVVLVTDAQASAWGDSATSLDAVRLLVATPGGASPANGSVSGARAIPERWTPRGTLEFTLRAVARGRPWTILADTAALARGTASGDSVQVVSVPLAVGDTGWRALRVALAPDALPADDTAHAVVHIGTMPRADGDRTPFVEAALNTLRETGRIERGGGVRIASAIDVTALPAIILPPSDAGSLPSSNAALARLGVPVRFAAPLVGNAPVRLLSPAMFRGDTGIRATRWYPLLPGSAGTNATLARVGSDAIAVRGDRWLVLGLPLDGAGSSLPLRASFLPWLSSAIGEVTLGTAPTDDVAAGAPLVAPAGADAFARIDALPSAAQPLPTRAPSEAGVYSWRRGGRIVGALRVGAPASESDLTRLDVGTLRQRLPSADTIVRLSDVRAVLQRGTAPRSLVWPFVLLSLLALVAEAIVSRAGAPRLSSFSMSSFRST
jgi:hypothetical protein